MNTGVDGNLGLTYYSHYRNMADVETARAAQCSRVQMLQEGYMGRQERMGSCIFDQGVHFGCTDGKHSWGKIA